MENSTSGYRGFELTVLDVHRAVSAVTWAEDEPLMSPRQMAQAGKDMARENLFTGQTREDVAGRAAGQHVSPGRRQGSGSVPSPGDRGQCCSGQDAGLEPRRVCWAALAAQGGRLKASDAKEQSSPGPPWGGATNAAGDHGGGVRKLELSCAASGKSPASSGAQFSSLQMGWLCKLQSAP